MDSQIKVLIVEDDADFSYLIRKLLEKQGDIQIVGCAANEEEAMQKVREELPDIVLMDLHLGTSSTEGIQLSRKIKIETNAKILIFTGLNTPDIIMKAAREALASGYIFKDQMSFLVENIRAVARGYTAQEYLIATSALSCLSEAEMSVFQIMMGKENDLQSSMKTIMNQRRTILKKLGLDNQKELEHVFRMFREK